MINNDNSAASAPRRRQAGVGLIEILVAVLLVSIGFLAAARMQVAGMQYSQGAYYQSQAYFMASEMVDRMRANSVGVNSGFYDDLVTAADVADPNCDIQVCQPQGIAAQDLLDWSEMLHGRVGLTNFTPVLPSSADIPARGSITQIAPGQYQITMQWSEVVDGEEIAQTLPIRFAIED